MDTRGAPRRVTGIIICLLTIAASAAAAAAAPDTERRRSGDGVWKTSEAEARLAVRPQYGRRLPDAYRVVSVEPGELKTALAKAPLEAMMSLGPQTIETYAQARPTISLPMPDGSFAAVAIEESPILSPELQARYPGIRTYRGQGVDDRTMTARLDQTPAGFHAQLISERGTVYIDPVEGASPGLYITYWRKDLRGAPFRCLFDPTRDGQSAPGTPGATPAAPPVLPLGALAPSGTQLRTYRLAVSATGEYGAFFGGVAGAAAQIATTMNRVTGIYERDLAIRFNLVATRIYTDKDTDPFTGDDVDVMRGENQTELDTNVGDANYDIGHIVSQGGSGGIASLAVACTSGSKARGATSLGNPSGDGFDVDFVAHEMGHQMGGDHTFDGTSDPNCGGNRVGSSAYEPGSGTTIMAYAGVCGAENIQAHSDPFFHTRSFDQITAYRDGGGACGSVNPTGNSVPVPVAGPDYTIPQGTPFTLTGSATDADSDSLTYDWEQFDLGPGIGQPSPTYTGPLFRAYGATASPSRTIPPLASLLSGTPTPWEVLPGINRDLNFRMTVRDNRLNGGGSDYDSMVVHVSGAPFSITSTGPFECGMPSVLNWVVGGGAADPNVQALLSTDNGASFPITLLASTPNDGSEGFTVPTTLTTQGWIKLSPIGNIYFALKGPLSIVDTTQPTITCPPDQKFVVPATPGGAIINYPSPTTSDVCDPSPMVMCTPASGSLFPLGDTLVTCTATDASGNHASCSFTVTVVGCPICDGTTVIVDQTVTVDFNTAVPTCLGDPDLCALFSYDTSGPTPDTWKAIFDLGAQRLLVQSGATITTVPVPAIGNNRSAPGIEFLSTCSAEIEPGGAIVVTSINQPAGAIVIQMHGDVVNNGTILNQVTGTNGTPGAIDIETLCGNVNTGPASLIQTIGQDHGGSNITIRACEQGQTPSGPAPVGGNILITGLVDASYKAAPASTIDINAPSIVPPTGNVTIDGNNLLGIEAGTGRRITSGVTVRSRRDPVAGFINIQSGNDLTVLGNRILTTNPAQQNFGAVAIKPGGTNGTSGDGALVGVSLAGRIVASDRAFDFANRFNAFNDITLFSRGNIELSVTGSVNAGAADNTKAVVSTQGGSAGRGGTNTLRSFSGAINIGAKTQVLANFTGTPGVNGINLLTACSAVNNSGTVNPADLNPGDDAGVCAPPAPSAILPLCPVLDP